MKTVIHFVLCALIMISFSGNIFAQAKPAEIPKQQQKPPEPPKKPTSPVKFGFIERVRNEAYNNIIDTDKNKKDKNNYIRYRTSLWGQYNFTPDIFLYGMLTHEMRTYFTQQPIKKDFIAEEVVVDNLYFQIKPNKTNPFGLQIGRQNLMYGEGFILMEGGPGDGSRTIYFNAVKLTYQKGATTLDVLGISDPQIDEYLPVFNSKQKKLIENKETAIGGYLTTKAIPDHQLEGYIIRKGEATNPKLKLYTVGGRLFRPMKKSVSFAAEWAYQSGTRGSVDKKGIGGYTYVSYMLAPQYSPTLTGGIIYLSGDDPKTTDDEGWDPLFSRWPKWSELYLYTLMNEKVYGIGKPVGYWTNYIAPYLKFSLKPNKIVTCDILNYFMRSDKERILANKTLSGKKRGNEFQIILNFLINKSWTAHFMYKYFTPNDYYLQPRSPGYFMRWQFQYAFTH